MTEIKRENAVNVKMNYREMRMLDALSEKYSMSRSETIRYLIRDRFEDIGLED